MEQIDGWCTRARVGEEKASNKQPFDTAEVQRGQARGKQHETQAKNFV